VRGHDHAIGVRTQSQIAQAAEYADSYNHLFGATARPDSDVTKLLQLLLTLTRKFSRAEAESLALKDAGDFHISDEVLRRDAKHLCELGSFSALVDYHNNVQKSTRLNLERVNSTLGNDPQIEKIRDIVQKGATIDIMAPDFTPIHRTAKASDRHHKTGLPTTEMQPAHRSPARVK
jgi:ribosomal protein S16